MTARRDGQPKTNPRKPELVPIEVIQEQYPSTKWGVDEWYAMLKARPDVYDKFIDVMGKISRQRPPPPRPQRSHD